MGQSIEQTAQDQIRVVERKGYAASLEISKLNAKERYVLEAVSCYAKDPGRLRDCAEQIIQYRKERQRWVTMRNRLNKIKDRLVALKQTAGLMDVTQELNELTRMTVWALGSNEEVDLRSNDIFEIKSSELFDATDSLTTDDTSEVDKLVTQLIEAQAVKQADRLPVLSSSFKSNVKEEDDQVNDREV